MNTEPVLSRQAFTQKKRLDQPDGEVIRVEKAVVVQKGMRFIDFEHELGHVQQEEGFSEPLATQRVLEDGRKYTGTNHGGDLTSKRDSIAEYHNRLVEFFRLKERGVDPAVLKEHEIGVRDAYRIYLKRGAGRGPSTSGKDFISKELPDLPDLEARFIQEQGPL